MIRPAKMMDIPRLLDILKDAHSRSHYAGLCGIDEGRAKGVLMTVVGASFEGQTYAAVSEKDGQVEGFILGVEEPVYLIGDKTMITDVFWVCTSRVDPRDPRALMKGMIAWGKTKPNAIEIRCGLTPVIQEPLKAGRMLKRLGFEPYGEFKRMELQR